MTIRFDSALLIRDLETCRKRRKLTITRISNRTGLPQSTIYGLKNGNVKDITVTSLARIMDFMGTTDIARYIYDDGEN